MPIEVPTTEIFTPGSGSFESPLETEPLIFPVVPAKTEQKTVIAKRTV